MTSQNTLPVVENSVPTFTVEHANRTLPYVRRVVKDICQTYRLAQSVQRRLDYHMPDESPGRSLEREYQQLVEQLNRYVDELHAVGVVLRDYEAGQVAFPSMCDGREIYLCWKFGDPQINSWHEVDAGINSCQPLALLEMTRTE